MAEPTVTLGDLGLTGTDEYGVTWATTGVEGWDDSTGTTLAVTQRTRASGGWAGLAYDSSRNIAATGVLTAPSRSARDDALDRLRLACSSDETTFAVDDLHVYARRSDQVLVTRWGELDAEWSIQLVATDPRKFGATLTGSTGLPTTTGGLLIPYTIPYTIDAVTTSGQVSLANPGNAPGPVRLRVDGPVTGPVVTHVSTGLVLALDSAFSMGSGEFLTVDMDARSVLAQGQVSRSGWLTSRQWCQFEPGVNVWAFTAATASPGALLTVSADPAWE